MEDDYLRWSYTLGGICLLLQVNKTLVPNCMSPNFLCMNVGYTSHTTLGLKSCGVSASGLSLAP